MLFWYFFCPVSLVLGDDMWLVKSCLVRDCLTPEEASRQHVVVRGGVF